MSPIYSRDAKLPPLLQPMGKEVLGQPFAKLELDRLLKPALQNIKHQKDRYDHSEGEELDEKARDILLRNGIVERLVPGIEPDLTESSCADNSGDATHKKQERPSTGAAHQSRNKRVKLARCPPPRNRLLEEAGRRVRHCV